jgi:hypothetical protein
VFREKGRGEYNACNNHAQINSHTGLTQLIEGSVAAWLVTFQLDGGNSINTAISVPLASLSLRTVKSKRKPACEAALRFRF